MRAAIVPILAIMLTVVLAGAVYGQATEGVYIFNGRDGSGPSQELPVGFFQVNGKQLSPGDGAAPNVSVKVSLGYWVRFCSGKDGSGTCEEFGNGTHNLKSTDFNSIKVWKGDPTVPNANPGTVASATAPVSSGTTPPLLVYEEKNWGGRAQIFGPGMYRSFKGEFGKINDNQARSIIVAKGFRARFCTEEGRFYRGAGECEIHEEGRHNLRFANSISFVEVMDLRNPDIDDEAQPVVLYEDPSQVGKMQGFDVGTFLASRGEFRKMGNDQASSIEVRSGYRASVCSDEPATGGEATNCEEFGPGRKNLKNKKSASYLRVWKDGQ